MYIDWRLSCQKTTENGQDEVYILVAGKTSDGREVRNRLPSPSGHWDINDGRDPRAFGPVRLVDMPLSPGQSARFVVAIMEEDGGTTQPWQEMAGQILGTIPTGITQALAGFLNTIGKFLVFHDSDDYIGSFEIKIRNENGALNSEWAALERCNYIPNAEGPDTHGFRLNGDGSGYFGWGNVVA